MVAYGRSRNPGPIDEVAGFATGGTVTETGGYRIHTFTMSATLTVTIAVTVDYLVIGGGGGGAAYGGGGAGAVWSGSSTLTADEYSDWLS